MSFGGGGSYTVEAPPAKLYTKNVTEAAESARSHQRERASRARGLRSSIHTSPEETLSSAVPGKTLLGV